MARNDDARDEPAYRPAAGPDDESAFARILERSFGLQRESSGVAWRRLGGDVRVLDDGGEVVACLGWYDCGQWFGGRSVPCAGIAAVGVEPHRRGAGLASRLVRCALRETAQRGFPIAALYPSNLALYRSADFEVAGGRYELDARCRDLPRVKGAEPLVPLPEGVHDHRVRALHRRSGARRDGWIDRNEALWDRVREFRGELREGFGVERGGELAGYVFVARRKRRSWGFDLVVGDLAADDAPAARALLAFLAAHATIAVDVQLFLAPWDPVCGLLDGLPARHALHHPWMLRVLDVPAALAARGFARHVQAEVEIAVEDRLLPHNHDRFVVTVEDGVARVRRGGAGRVRLAARALGPWYTGAQTAEALAFRGLASGPAADLAALSAMTAGAAPWTADFF
ncbi:MAG: GNAT family N-acetyltransferase [Planctomycetes bacterium]|nr:GNAT family N-acetyltransferase [Planctomycetota bacterium]